MDNTLEIRTIYLNEARKITEVEHFLKSSGLVLDAALQSITGIYTPDDELVGCAGLDGRVVKCVAMSESMRGEGLAATLISEIMRQAFEQGQTYLMLFTKPEYESLFAQLGFTACGKSGKAVLMLSSLSDLQKYKEILSAHKCDAAIVMNLNPCTIGHQQLITYAAQHSKRVAIIPLADHKANMFTEEERVEMLRRAISHLHNVEIMPTSPYTISAATFPSYFLKEATEVFEAQAELDLDIFVRHIVPSLGVKRRYIGSEPVDKFTADYNALMHSILPKRGVEIVEIPRFEDEDSLPISASSVRKALQAGNLAKVLHRVPPTSLPFMLTQLALRALRMELDLAPKPGLVDPIDSGSHTDMDYTIMLNGITALRPYFTELSLQQCTAHIDGKNLRRLGIQAEQQMLMATGGVNTHKGALFALGIAVVSATRIIQGISHNSLREEITAVAYALKDHEIPEEIETHGQEVRKRTGLPGAKDYAICGYNELFESWLPYLQKHRNEDYVLHKLLLKIISEIDDSNACYRAGVQRAALAKKQALTLLQDFSLEGMETLNKEFKKSNISHGGAADMLSLTIFIDSVLAACEACAES